MLIYVVRHGQSEGNINDTFTGITNVALTPKGIEQARLTAEYLSPVSFSAIYSSDLIRAVQTAQPHAKMRNMEIAENKGLREINAGEWEGKNYYSLFDLYPQTFKVWTENIGQGRPNGGESVTEVQKSVYDAMEEIATRHDGETVLVVTHALALRTFIAKVKGETLDGKTDSGYVPNSSVTIVEYNKGKFTVKEEGYDAHLGDLTTKFP